MTAEGKCRSCLHIRPLAELVAVTDRVKGDRWYLCRPGLAPCFGTIGSSERYEIQAPQPVTQERTLA